MKAPNLDELQPQPAVAAGRADARIGAVLARREQMRRQHLIERVDHAGNLQILGVVDRADEIAPEIAQHLAPRHLAVGDEIELLFEAGGEIVFDVFGEIAFQERDHDAAAVLGVKPALVEPHIFAVFQHLQDRGIGRGPADAELFHALDQRRFGIARRRLGKMLVGLDLALGEPLARAHLRQPAGLLVLGILVLAFLVEREKTVEIHHGAGGAQIEHAAADIGGDLDRGALELGGFHLARHGAQPNELVELGLIRVQNASGLARPARKLGRADRFVGFLGVLRLGFVAARGGRHVFRAVIGADDLPHGT